MRFALILLLAARLVAADTISDAITQDFYPPTDYSGTVNNVEKEFECIRVRADDPTEMIKSANAKAMIKRLSPALENGFQRFKFSGLEKALFYSQVIEESGGFTQLTEAKDFSNSGADPLAHMINSFENDAHFAAKQGATQSKQFGDFRGRGLLQISRCDNFFSVMHYLNLMNAGKPPVWKAYWEYGEKEDRKQISAVCSKKELYEMKKEYVAKQGMNANLYGAIDEPIRFAMIGGEFTDPVTKKKISSEQFMVDSSMAYWRGRCGDVAEAARSLKSMEKSAECKPFKSPVFADWAAQCMTKCIKGTTEGWQRRSQWLQRAMFCQR